MQAFLISELPPGTGNLSSSPLYERECVKCIELYFWPPQRPSLCTRGDHRCDGHASARGSNGGAFGDDKRPVAFRCGGQFGATVGNGSGVARRKNAYTRHPGHRGVWGSGCGSGSAAELLTAGLFGGNRKPAPGGPRAWSGCLLGRGSSQRARDSAHKRASCTTEINRAGCGRFAGVAR